MNEPIITRHRTPPPALPASNLGHVKAEGDGATVYMPVSLDLIDDTGTARHYIDTKLKHFHRLEVERMRRRGEGRDE